MFRPPRRDWPPAVVNTARLFGGALGLAVLAAIATARTTSDLHHAMSANAALTGGFVIAFAVAAALAGVGTVIGIFGLPRVRPRSAAHRVIAAESV